MKRRSSALLLSVVLGATVAACADVDVTGADVSAVRTVTVRPRVVVDGTVELADRSNGHLSVDAIIAHADGARVVALDDSSGATVVDSDTAPVFFSFADTIDDQVAAQREWQVPVEGGLIAMAFGPADSVDSGIAGTDGLLGHTALIHGTITIPADDVAFGESAGEIDPDGSPAEPTSPAGGPDDIDVTDADTSAVDPDGTPARPIKGAVDPDGTPARPTSPAGDPDDVGAVKNGENDPDGSPARPGNGGLVSAVDPDGTPARPIKGEVDPDGSPARSTKRNAVKLDASQAAKEAVGGFARGGEVRVPFTLVVDGAFSYEAVVDAAALADVGADEVLPLDLRIAATDIFTAERIVELQQLARASLHAAAEQSLVVAVNATTTAAALDVSVSHALQVDEVNLEEAPQVDAQMIVSAVR